MMSDPTASRPVANMSTGPRGRLRVPSRFQTAAYLVVVVDLVLVIAFSAFSPDHSFFQVSNFQNIALGSSQIILLTVGIAFLLGAAELDISLGANVILSSVLGSKLMLAVAGSEEDRILGVYSNLPLGIAVGVVGTILIGAAIGAVNGFIVTRLKVNSFIATLGMLGILTGLSLVVTDGANVPYIPFSIQSEFGVKTILGVPAPAWFAFALIGVLWWIFAKTTFGVKIRAIGSSREAAQRSGIKTDAYVMRLFVLAGGLAGVSAIFDVSRFATTNVSGHQTDALAAIAGAVIGGTSLFGGRVSVGGAIAGALLAQILQVGLVIMGLPSFYQLVVVGLILIVAVAMRERAIRSKNDRPTSSGG